MKNSKSKLALLVAAALAGTGHLVSAQSDVDRSFTPIEDLPPEMRANVEAEISYLSMHTNVDWDAVVIGVNEDGEIVLKPKDSVLLQHVDQPSCWDMKEK